MTHLLAEYCAQHIVFLAYCIQLPHVSTCKEITHVIIISANTKPYYC